MIFYEPDITAYSKDFLDQATKCPGLEQLTGADFVICKLPIPPTSNLQIHIDDKALFIQVKIGYDIASFDNLHSSIARMQQCKIPKGQAILLPIGEYWEDENGLLRIKGKKAFGDTKYSTLGTIYDMWEMRGGTVEALPPKDISDLMPWIERKQKSIQKIDKEGKREIYPQSPVFLPDDIWQNVEEINDWRKFLVSGLDGFGSKKANAVFQYANEHYPNATNFYLILCILTNENEKGKAMHKVPLWGDASRKELRAKLGIPDGWNLSQLDFRIAFYQGQKAFGNAFLREMRKKKTLSVKVINDIYKKLMEQAEMSIIEDNEIPF